MWAMESPQQLAIPHVCFHETLVLKQLYVVHERDLQLGLSPDIAPIRPLSL